MAKEKRESQEEKEWIRAKIQAIRKLIKEHDERLQRNAEIRAIRKRIRALEEKERHQIEKREFSNGVSVVKVLCCPDEGEALEEEYSDAEHMGAKEEEQILPLLEEQMVGQCIKSVAEDVDRPSNWDVGKENGSFSENEVDKVAAEEKIAGYLQLMHVGIEVPRKDIEQGVTEKTGGVPIVNAVEGQKVVRESLNVSEQRTNDNLKNEFMEKYGLYQGLLMWLLLIRLLLCRVLWLYFDQWRRLKKT